MNRWRLTFLLIRCAPLRACRSASCTIDRRDSALCWLLFGPSSWPGSGLVHCSAWAGRFDSVQLRAVKWFIYWWSQKRQHYRRWQERFKRDFTMLILDNTHFKLLIFTAQTLKLECWTFHCVVLFKMINKNTWVRRLWLSVTGPNGCMLHLY